jgi:hypothetical protein
MKLMRTNIYLEIKPPKSHLDNTHTKDDQNAHKTSMYKSGWLKTNQQIYIYGVYVYKTNFICIKYNYIPESEKLI